MVQSYLTQGNTVQSYLTQGNTVQSYPTQGNMVQSYPTQGNMVQSYLTQGKHGSVIPDTRQYCSDPLSMKTPLLATFTTRTEPTLKQSVSRRGLRLTVQIRDPWRCQGEWEGRRSDCRHHGTRWWSAVSPASLPLYAALPSACESL